MSPLLFVGGNSKQSLVQTCANYFEAYSSRCPLHHGTSPESSGNWSVFAGGFAVVVSTEIGLNCNDVMEVRDGLCLGTENRTHFSDIFGLHDAQSCHRMVLGGWEGGVRIKFPAVERVMHSIPGFNSQSNKVHKSE